MADFDDLKLDKSAAPPPPPRPRWIPVVAIAALVVAAVALWLYLRDSPDIASSQSADASQSPVPARETEPTAGEELPPLDESDAFVRDLIGRLSQHPLLASLLTTDQLIRTFAVSIHNLAGGNTPAPHLHTIPPGTPIQVETQGGRTVIDPRSYARFDRHAAAVDGLDAAGAARTFQRLKPRIEEAYREVAGPSADFDRAFERAVANVLQTPVIEEPIAVQRAVAGYTYADPKLESLPRAQQQLLRMGPENVRTMQRKVREIARELGAAQ